VAALCAGGLAVASSSFAAADPAQNFPSKPIRFIVPFVPGAGTDTTGRTIAAKLAEHFNQQVVVDNRTGAAGVIGVDLTKVAAPDGYTICLISGSHTVSAAVNPDLPYDLTRDLQGISEATALFYVQYMNPAVPATNVKELIAYAKANPGKLNFGSSGTGGLEHISGELFDYMAGVKMTHVPYKGAAGVTVAVLANEVQLGYSTLFGVRPHWVAGRLKVLAITAAKRSQAAPELPTLSEAGLPGYEINQAYGVITGAKVPRPIVNKISGAIAEALKQPDLIARLSADGAAIVGSTPDQYNAYIRNEIDKYRKLVKEANLKLM
jgi:tripartite-type tricarboxylate transporter receptor subunit TctC